VLGVQRGKLVVCVVVGATLALAGCGGSGSSAERTQLVHKLSAQNGDLAPDLAACVNQHAGQLPISQLRELANAGANPSAAAKQTAVQLIATCLKEGKGLAALRTVLVQGVMGSLSTSLPASYRSCVAAKANALPAGQLSGLISAYGTGGQSAVQSQAVALGRQLGLACLSEPSVLDSFRAIFLAPIRQFAQSSHFSAAFRNCVLRKAEQVPASQLKQFALNPAGAGDLGTKLGQGFAKACIAEGAKP
jgi:hypothetical protein